MSQLLNFLASDLGTIALLSLFFLISSISKFNHKKNQRASENKKSKENETFIDVRKEILKKRLERKKEQEISSSSNLETKILKLEEKDIIEANNPKMTHKAERISSENATGKSDQSVFNYDFGARKVLHVDLDNDNINADTRAQLIRKKIRNGFKSREASKAALISGEILAKPVSLRIETF